MRNDDAPLIGLMSGTSMDAVDAVLVCDPALAAAVPVAWQAAPMHVLPWAEWGESWVQEGALFECLETLWPAHHAAR